MKDPPISRESLRVRSVGTVWTETISKWQRHVKMHNHRATRGRSQLRAMYLDAEKEDGYFRDQSVFGDGISIEDTMAVTAKYKSGAVMTYSLTAYSPVEGFRVAFTGDKSRLEQEVIERAYINAGGNQAAEGALENTYLVLRPIFQKPSDIEIPVKYGGYGGGDPELLNDLFGEPGEDVYRRRALHVDGALSILTGIAANKPI